MSDTDQKRLYGIAADGSKRDEARQAAIAALTDIDALLEIAAEDDDWRISLCAYRRLALLDALPEEPTGVIQIPSSLNGSIMEYEWPVVWLPQPHGSPRLVRVKMKPEKARCAEDLSGNTLPRAALFCLNTETEFRYVVTHDTRPKVRCAAIQKFRADDAYYFDLALRAAYGDVRLAAAKRLTDEKLTDRLLQEGTGGVRSYAATKTRDLALLKAVALFSNEKGVHREALMRVKDWSLLEIVTMLSRVQGISKGLARAHMKAQEQAWKKSGIALLQENQRLFADAAINDNMMYRLTIEHFTDEACIADILCALSPHTAGATAYGSIGHVDGIGRVCSSSNPNEIQRAKRALNKVHAPELLKRISEEAKSDLMRNEAAARLSGQKAER